ncbi:MAG: hypothetical protein MHPSP_004317, partial [Paramarteilia canceri]
MKRLEISSLDLALYSSEEVERLAGPVMHIEQSDAFDLALNCTVGGLYDSRL